MGFRVLGPLEVVGDEEVELGGPQQRIVMAVLVLRANETVSTDALIEAVWEARPPATALQVVRTYVYRLRRAMSSAGVRAGLVGRPSGYRVEVDPDDVDAARFERLARQGRHEAGAGDAEAASATLAAALGLWRGPFLADLAERPCFRPVVVRFEELRIATVEDRIEVDLALGRHANVAGELEELTARHPFHERLWGQRIVALYRSGRQADALAAYQAVRTALGEQLGIVPGPALQRLERDVLGQVEDLGSTAPERAGRAALPVALAGGPESRPLVGRTDELSRLDRSFRAVREGKFQAVLVTGAPGIGKTALASRCARVAHDHGALVVLGRSEDDLTVPYHPLRSVICQWIAGPGATELAGMADADAALLSRVAPEIRDHRIVAREPSPPDDDIDRLRLYEAIGRWVASLAARGPALVVLEDLHWADHATLLALRHLLRHPPAAGAMVLMTYRDTEPEPAPATGLASLVADAGHDGHVVHIEVAGLRPGEVVELLRAELGPLDEAGNAFAERLTRRTGGNPLFIHETLRHLGRRGGALGPTTAWPGDRDLNALGVPTGVSRVVDRRLHQLPAPTVTVLREASVIGQEFDLLVLSRMLGIAEMSVLDALQPAVASTLVRPTGRTAAGRADGFAFSHALVRDAVFETLPLADRPPAHWRAGQAIAELRASHRELHVEDIARHLAAGVDAGDTATAVAAGIEAGQRAMAALAFEDAVEWFRTATGLLASTRPVGPGLEFDAWFGLGTAALATGRGADLQRDGYLQAARIARSQHWPDRLARSVIGLTFHSLNADEPAAQGMRQPGGSEIERLGAEALARLDEKAPERAFLLGMAAVVAVRWGRGHAAHDLAGLAEEVARSVDDPTALGGALLGRCWTMLGGPHPRELARTAERALALADGWETRSLLHTLVLPHVVVAPLLRGDRAGFDAACARVAAHPAVRRSEHLHGYLRMLEAAIALASGRLDEAERSAASISGRDEWWIWHEAAEIQSTAIAGERGRFDHVVSQAGTALAFVPDAATPRVMLTLVGTRSDPARPRLGGEELEDLGRLVHGKLYDQPPNWDSPVLLALTGELAARHEAASLARVVLPKVSEYSGQMLVSFLGTTILGAADRTRGQALLALGRPDEACRHLEAARDLERSLGVEGLVAHSRYWLARAHAAGGRRREASEMAGATLADAEHLGLRTVAEDCRALLRRLA